MAAPQVVWYNDTNTTQETSWAIGTVDAGSIGTAKTFLIWNNRAGASALSDMTSCTITTKDNAGGNAGELITSTWIEVRVDSLSEVTFTKIGGTTTKVITAETAASGVIQGTANDGNVATAATKKCFAKITVQPNIPATATAGNVNFLTRVAYQYT